MWGNSNLYQAVRDYVQAAMSLLAEACHEGPPRVIFGLDEWKRDPDNIFRLRDREEPFWVQCIEANRDRLHELNEYRRVVAALRTIPHISQQLENLVGTVQGSQRIEVHHVADYVVWRMPQSTGELRFRESQFDHLFNRFEADLNRTSLAYVVVAPLLGLKVEPVPIQLEPDIEVDNMTDEEIVRCLRLGMFRHPFGMGRMAQIGSPAAVRVRYSLEKWIGPHEEMAGIEQALGAARTAVERAMEVLHALRLFKDGRVSVPGLIQFSPHWPVDASTSFQYSNPGRQPWFNKFELHASEAADFSAFWEQFDRVATKGVLANAARRFSDASDRDRDDDRLVDLMIAAESLFLSDAGAPQERGELRYRLALRAAFFIDSNEYSRRQIFKHMRRSYNVRSAIVHGGGEPDPDLLKSPTDAPLSLRDFTKVTEHLLRIALKKGIAIAKSGKGPVTDWESLIMPP